MVWEKKVKKFKKSQRGRELVDVERTNLGESQDGVLKACDKLNKCKEVR